MRYLNKDTCKEGNRLKFPGTGFLYRNQCLQGFLLKSRYLTRAATKYDRPMKSHILERLKIASALNKKKVDATENAGENEI
jgi:hypothetical protein